MTVLKKDWQKEWFTLGARELKYAIDWIPTNKKSQRDYIEIYTIGFKAAWVKAMGVIDNEIKHKCL